MNFCKKCKNKIGFFSPTKISHLCKNCYPKYISNIQMFLSNFIADKSKLNFFNLALQLKNNEHQEFLIPTKYDIQYELLLYNYFYSHELLDTLLLRKIVKHNDEYTFSVLSKSIRDDIWTIPLAFKIIRYYLTYSMPDKRVNDPDYEYKFFDSTFKGTYFYLSTTEPYYAELVSKNISNIIYNERLTETTLKLKKIFDSDREFYQQFFSEMLNHYENLFYNKS